MSNNKIDLLKAALTRIRSIISIDSMPAALLAVHETSKFNLNDEKIYEFITDWLNKNYISNPFNNASDALLVYNSIHELIDEDGLLEFFGLYQNEMFPISQIAIEKLEISFNNSAKNILICEGEKFALSLKNIINANNNSKITITTQNHLAKIIMETVFQPYDYVQIVEASIYRHEFINNRFDLILAVPHFGGRLLVDSNQSFICREHEMVATENLLLHLSVGGKLLIILPAKITFASGRIQELRRFIQEMYKIEEIAELPSGIFPSTGIKTYLFTITSGKTDDINIKRYNLVGAKNDPISLELKDETFVMLSELEDIGDWSVDKIFALQDEDWNKYQASDTKKIELGNLAEIFRGKVVNNKDENGRIGVINISNLREFDINYDTLDHLDEEDRKISSHILKSGDLLLTARGTAIRTAVFQEQNYPCIASSNIIVIRPKEGLLFGTYLKVFFDSEIGSKIVKAMQQGTTIMNISYKDLANILIPHIPFGEQQQIADEYQNELKLYQESIKTAEDKWSDVIKRLQSKF